MKIPRNLPQFEADTTLIIVAGRQDAVFYKVARGIIDRLDVFKIPRPHYSDNEGDFRMSGKGVFISSGGVQEPKNEKIIKDFIHELKQRIKKIKECERIYIFAPSKTKNRIQSALPIVWQKRVVKIIAGNYYYHPPLSILKKISQIEAISPVFLIWHR